MDASGFLDRLRNSHRYDDQVVHVHKAPPRTASDGEPESPLHPLLQDALAKRGLWPLYNHQSQAIDSLRAGRNVIVAIPAASGKSLCYHIPVLESALSDRNARSLYLHPTKALTQDQHRALAELADDLPCTMGIFDGDTPLNQRSSIKISSQILLTNPDMLHLGILPNHKTWSRFLQNLKYMVLDEAHIYRGVFGSHVANVIRRLRRLCAVYGSSPRLIMCSATIANPVELAQKLTGLPFEVIDHNGAPSGGKQFAFWNPPVNDKAKSTRRSSNTESALIFSELVRGDIRTITFVRTRQMAELVTIYAKERLAQQRPEIVDKISPYRASYLPEDRRRIEQALVVSGDLTGVTTTNALELGIDICDLEATVITGYPGSVCSTWQQAARSGRRSEESIAFLVATDNPLDQCFMNHPEAFFERPLESALISTENPHIMHPHMLCAAYERPLDAGDENLFGPAFKSHLDRLVEVGMLKESGNRWYIATEVSYPAESVNIRSTSPYSYVVVDTETGKILETLEEASAFHELHPGAIYLYQGEPYLVDRLDLENKIAYTKPDGGKYYTQTRDLTDIRIKGVRRSKSMDGIGVFLGDMEVTTHVLAFRKKVPMTEETLGEEALDLPPQRFDTVGLWFDIPPSFLDRAKYVPVDLPGGLHAAEHSMIGVLPLFAMCDRNDIGRVSTPLHPDTGKPQVFIYDGHPGGIGIAERGFHVVEDLVKATWQLITDCPCESGCPRSLSEKQCSKRYASLVECKDATYSMTKSRLL